MMYHAIAMLVNYIKVVNHFMDMREAQECPRVDAMTQRTYACICNCTDGSTSKLRNDRCAFQCDIWQTTVVE